jgi:hypothetical protein
MRGGSGSGSASQVGLSLLLGLESFRRLSGNIVGDVRYAHPGRLGSTSDMGFGSNVAQQL